MSNIEGGGGPVFLSEEYQRLVEGLREAHINRETDVILANPGNIVKHRGGGGSCLPVRRVSEISGGVKRSSYQQRNRCYTS